MKSWAKGKAGNTALKSVVYAFWHEVGRLVTEIRAAPSTVTESQS